jgi:aerobic-type carbon monoxide dehydrogenase small subunit (CoxS/CutS family)
MRVTLIVNGQPRAMTAEPRTTLFVASRQQLELTGTKKGDMLTGVIHMADQRLNEHKE